MLWSHIVLNVKRRKAELGGICPKAVKHTDFASCTYFTLEKMNRTEKVEAAVHTKEPCT